MRDRRTYVLRVWIEPGAAAEGRPALRATLQPAEGGEPRPFSSLEQLAAFVRAELLGPTEAKEDRR